MSDQSTPEVKKTSYHFLWEKVSTVLALIGLVDLTSQLVKWAALIHWLASEYAVLRTWLFGWLPFQVPPAWHNYIVLLAILFSVTTIGFYRRTGEIYLAELLLMPIRLIGGTPIWERYYVPDREALTFKITEYCWLILWNGIAVYVISLVLNRFFGVELPDLPPFAKWMALGVFIGSTGFLIAWRWIAATAFLFGILVGVNEIYVHLLARSTE